MEIFMEGISLPLSGLLAAFCVALAAAPLLIRFLHRLKFGQQIITEYGPTWHKGKQGVPTMGGFIFIGGAVIAYLLFGAGYYTSPQAGQTVFLPSAGVIALLVSLLLGLMGFADDFVKIRKKHNQGLTEKQKLFLQGLIGVGFLIYDALRTGGRTWVEIPFVGFRLELSYFYYVFALILFVGFVNAVNLTDGLDGLATSVTLPVLAFFGVTAFLKGAMELSLLSAAVFGACAAFLIFNWHPAKVFMGDTGSMFLGGMVSVLAFLLDMPLMLVVVGLIYLAEAVSVMIQMTYFKLTHGKRLFKMTPIHHHFELCKWSEVKIVLTFSGISLVMCAAAFIFCVL